MSVISMADVLEHIPFPRPALETAHRLLKPRGVLFLSMPNIESFVWLALDEAGTNPYWGELEHYHNFGRTRLYTLLRETGFSPVHYTISHRYRAGMEVIAIRT
jgi:protein O-GlcNAc transferase